MLKSQEDGIKVSKIIIAAKYPPPFYGTTIWFDIVRKSKINDTIGIEYLNVGVRSNISEIGRGGVDVLWRYIKVYYKYYKATRRANRSICHISISQSVVGLIKDSIFIWISVINGHVPVIQLHGSALQEVVNKAPRFCKYYILSTLRKADAAIVLSERFSQIFKNIGIKYVYKVRNGANYKETRSNYDVGISKVVFVGNIQRSKGVLDAVKSIAELKKRGYGVKLIIVGNWKENEMRMEMYNIIRESEIDVDVRVGLSRAEVMNSYLEAQMMIFVPRAQEGHPWVINEALACAMPIISTDKGMIADAVIDGYNGYIVPPERPDIIADRLEALLSNMELVRIMGERSRKMYLEEYIEERMMEELYAAYKDIAMRNDLNVEIA